ncbi:fumarylacetoacetate hydrolase family protein [Novosphingobium sp. AP12]|uniref:fumarylacetoacetate hydrolase family protein n=1 Tax=Novosphingobium sp. AP12 TaxID=1144305 RepID=UPI000271E708|nr:fumarylacetoacetate hydrolase family protein [Novosphingobium sp. AP12]EJL34495.1 fumarylacetoacetate (FAA) hydrolase family protein [Novosphingobium sp. AP12]
MTSFDTATMLPADWREGTFLGRLDLGEGPTPVLLGGGMAYDMSHAAPTVADLVDAGACDPARGTVLGAAEDVLARAVLLSPVDLQCIKAAGVTFAVSALERVIEERARGDADQAQAVRGGLEERIGGSIRSVVPGSPEAAALKAALIEDGMWSQYLEVAIGPDAEIFTKAPVLATVGSGAAVGVRSDSHWNNPEPEIVLLSDRNGKAVGAALGNDVNLRDFEGRSALLLGKAKDNNASCSIGPFVRLFDESYTIADVESAKVLLRIEGPEGFLLEGESRMSEISRPPLDLLSQAFSEHQYPDGIVLFLGTLFAPTQDRDAPGRGFTHKVGDVVTISSERLGTLVNPVATSRDSPAWETGISALYRNLAARGLVGPKATPFAG